MIKNFFCWIGWHDPDVEREHVFYSNRTMIEIWRCKHCKNQYQKEYGG